MFYRWNMKNAPHSQCYIWAVVPGQDTLKKGGKSYFSEGDLSAIEIWNVTSSPGPLSAVSWNTRPTRVSLLGTVNFTNHVDVLAGDNAVDGKQLRAPTPRFDCSGNSKITVEIACESCRLEYDQVFSDPALGASLLPLFISSAKEILTVLCDDRIRYAGASIGFPDVPARHVLLSISQAASLFWFSYALSMPTHVLWPASSHSR